MRQLAAIVVTVFVMCVMPGLCAGGVLHHSCECSEPTDCGHGCGEREDGCSDDPWSPITTGRNLTVAPEVVASSGPAPAHAPAAAPRFPGVFVLLRHVQKLPFPPSDVPLLI